MHTGVIYPQRGENPSDLLAPYDSCVRLSIISDQFGDLKVTGPRHEDPRGIYLGQLQNNELSGPFRPFAPTACAAQNCIMELPGTVKTIELRAISGRQTKIRSNETLTPCTLLNGGEGV